MQFLLSAIDSFPWSLSVLVMAVAAMFIFREPNRRLIRKSHELRGGPFRLKAEHTVNPKFFEDALREAREGAAKTELQVEYPPPGHPRCSRAVAYHPIDGRALGSRER